MRKVTALWVFLLASVLFCGSVLAQSVQYPSEVIYPTYYDTSLPLWELVGKMPPYEVPSGPPQEVVHRELPLTVSPFTGMDPVLQDFAGNGPMGQTIVNFEGISNLCNCYPPDPNGASGLDHYFQTVNKHFAIWDKQGNPVQGAQQLRVLWSGTPWGNRDDGDPIVLYDRYAHRWVIIQMYFGGDVNYLLFAVSASSDPLGSYHRYGFPFFGELPDYPKIAVWNDAYYLSIDRYAVFYLGPGVAAVERDQMLVGGNARIVYFQRTPADPSLLPSDVDGPTLPANTPNYFTGIDIEGQQLRIYELSVNWSNPSSSTFTHSVDLPTAPFVAPVCPTRDCIPQPGTNVGLDSFSDHLMFRLQYRNFNTYQTMVANHTVQVGAEGVRAGIRWYELRRTTGNWVIHQQGTYSPDDNSRWMASIAMDQHGNIGLGYSVASSSIYPSIRLTGRAPSDPPGQMTINEGIIVNGSGSQLGVANRWGDYSSLHLDPGDDWTFWYTNEYIQTTGNAPWQTRITAFKIRNVAIDQLRADGTRLEYTSVGRWTGFSFSALPITSQPTAIGTFDGEREVLRGDQERAASEKYRVWERNFAAQLDTVQNHRGFTIRQDDANLTSRFHTTDPTITIKTDLLDATGTTGGNVQLKDPWLIDFQDAAYGNNVRNQGMSAPFKTRSSPFNPDYTTSFNGDVYKGVFLNQSGPIFNWAPPYYSVGAPNPNTFTIGGNNYQAYFRGWEGTNVQYQNAAIAQTGVVFTNSGATATAKYKLHLASSSVNATASNTQRKVVRDAFGVYHAVYPSAGLIWYTRSTDGVTWSAELLLSSLFLPPDVYYRSPSLTFVPGTNYASSYVLAVWEAYGQDERSRCVYYCQLDLDGHIVEGPESVDCWDSDEPAYSPVVGAARFSQFMGPGEEEKQEGGSIDAGGPPTYYYYPLILWYNPQWQNSLRGIIKYGRQSWSYTGGLIGLSDVTVYSIAPFSYDDGTWDIAYISGNDLYYAPVYVNSNFPTLGTPELVKEGDPMWVYVKNPSIARVGSTVGISWEEYYWEFVSGAVKYSQRAQADVWTNPVGWWPVTGYFRTPSLHGEPDRTNATIAWQNDATAMYYVQGQLAQWSGVTSLGTGVGPVMSIGFGGAQAELVLSRGTTSPYVIQRQSISTSSRIGLSNPVVIAEGRGSNLAFCNGSLHIAVLDAQSNDMRLSFAEMNDTARINLSQFENVFATEPFAGTGTLKLTTLFTAKGQLPNGINIRMTLRDAATGNVVQNLRTFHVGDDTLVTFQTSLNHGNRQLKLVLQPVGVAQLSRIDLERWYVVDEAASLAKQLANTTTPGGLPEVFAVHPNYPNPFNPSTTIKYDLPEASQVSLVVFDLLGRKVTELVSGQKSEGYHSATWDASGVASGVYFVSFTATDGSGNVRLNKVNKLLLTK